VSSISQVLADASTETDTADEFTDTVLQVMIQCEIGHREMERRGVVVTEAERQSIVSSTASLGKLQQNPVSATFINCYADLQVAMKMGDFAAAFNARALGTPIRVNPRYGAWDQETGELIKPSATPSPRK
jgi:hypothetical protein